MTETPRRQTLRKHERLHENKAMELVFQKGNSINTPPIRLLWTVEKNKSNISIQVAFSAPKRIFKNAVTRNLIKRRMREAYRKNKISKTPLDETYALIFIYTARKISSYTEITSKIVLTLQHFKTATGAE